ncbi:MAG TPA: Flp pilus assembly protein CpaB [Chloroflexi bacterium]|nr:MAG: Flp pilus assembly protein CpaB [Chloroflexota bacterium]HDD56329.1 Flp pilus assembly protein CpaB [Chloroflexota bacterium]
MVENKIPTTTPDWQAAVRRRTRFYILVAILLAVLFGFLVFQFFSRQQTYAPGETTSVIVAAEAIPGGTLLTGAMVEFRTVPIGILPDSYLSAKEQAVGQLTLYPLVKGEPILNEKLARNQGGFLAQRCPAGKWCLSIPVSWFIASPPDLAVGDRVEIASAQPGRGLEEAGFIAAQVQVIALPSDAAEPAYVLAVDDREALNLLYARVNEFQLLVLLRPTGG